MDSKRYNLINNITGWLAFAIAAITYILTTEASASFWDCGEFISTADKLLVGHPPGAPLFMIMGRFFAILAPSVETIAKMINIMSALASAFTILFLFWTITHLARKIFIEGESEAEEWRTWAVMGAGLVGSLAYTFSDTFWFSAVEGEVYGMSSLFTALVFWCILKWEAAADTPGANRWLVLIAYLMGLSIGVHLLNLLCIPAMGMVYYYKKYNVTTKGVIFAFLTSCAILLVVLYGIIPGLVKIAGFFELFFVNGLGFGYNSGAIFWMLLLFGGLGWGLFYTYKHQKELANTIIACVSFIVIGYSSFAMVVIRSASDPTMDQNSPDNVFALIDYLNREQYGDRPLFFGQSWVSPIDRAKSSETGSPIYAQRNGKYEVIGNKPTYKYQATMFFPRMYSTDSRHVSAYKQWSDYKGQPVSVTKEDGQRETVMRPTFWENMRFFLSYQVNYMYFRYFLWNFSGRQNDIQGNGELIWGNWITGIGFIDNLMLGDQDLMPDYMKENKGHNRYFMLPLILGLIGIFYQYGRGKKGRQGFWVTMLLFFMTGLAIVMYLNQTPYQPRERDYAYAGSFYAFTIWIGLGVLALVEWTRKLGAKGIVAPVAATSVALLAVPCLMAQQNWDDHDRSGCTVTRDIAYNYLNSCEENSIIFTNGDNDTFPLWYAQEVEGCRTDVRVCNLSYLQTDWYCDQMKRKAYKSEPLPISFTHEQYSGDRDVVYLLDMRKEAINLKDAINFVRSDDKRTKQLPNYAGLINYIPGHKFTLPVSKSEILGKNVVEAKDSALVLPSMDFSIGKNYILKNELMVLDMLANNNWNRPMYYAVTVGEENYAGLTNFFQLEGLSYRIVPIKTAKQAYEVGRVSTDRMYDNIMNKFRWGFYNQDDIYYDENKRRMATNLRNNLSRLAQALLDESNVETEAAAKADKKKKAVAVLDKILTELPGRLFAYNYFCLSMAECYYKCDNLQSGDEIIRDYAKNTMQELQYYLSLSPDKQKSCTTEIRRDIAIASEIMRVANTNGRTELLDELEKDYSVVEEVAKRAANSFQ